MLDHKLIEFVGTLPTEMKISSLGSKLILRESLKDLLPKKTLERPKQGFEVPLRRWLKHDLKGCVEDLLLQSNTTVRDYVDHRFIQSLWKAFSKHNDRLAARKIWLLLNFAIWYEEHWN